MSTAEAEATTKRPDPPRPPERPPRDAVRWLLAGLLLLAFGLRIVGIDHGLPFIYNADENAHFVPRAIGMFGHDYNPDYFINPPAYTYLLHVAFFVGFGGRVDVSNSLAADPTTVFVLARTLSALLGTIAVGLLYLAGRELFDRKVGLLAAALLTVSFLPVHYAHFALNDVPALAPLCLALWGAARIYRRGGFVSYAIGGAGLGLACATKYTAGIVLLCLIAGAVLGESQRATSAARRAALFGALVATSCAAFVIANPYAVLDWSSFTNGLEQQSTASSDGGGKLGLTEPSGTLYYLETLGWGFGLLPVLAVLIGIAHLITHHWRSAVILIPAPIVFVLFMGSQDRFFARWLLPSYPVLCLLAAVGGVFLAREAVSWWGGRKPRPYGYEEHTGRRVRHATWGVAALLCFQGALYSTHNDIVLAREDTRSLVREWMKANVPEGSKVVVEPVFPDQWAQDPGRPSDKTGNGNRWIKWATSKTRLTNEGKLIENGRSRIVKLEDYERTTRPDLVGSYARGGFCWVVTGSTQYGRAFAEPGEVPNAIRYYDELRRVGRVVYRVSPIRGDGKVPEFSFDFSFNSYPLSYARPGPEIVVYRLGTDDCVDSLREGIPGGKRPAARASGDGGR